MLTTKQRKPYSISSHNYIISGGKGRGGARWKPAPGRAINGPAAKCWGDLKIAGCEPLQDVESGEAKTWMEVNSDFLDQSCVPMACVALMAGRADKAIKGVRPTPSGANAPIMFTLLNKLSRLLSARVHLYVLSTKRRARVMSGEARMLRNVHILLLDLDASDQSHALPLSSPPIIQGPWNDVDFFLIFDGAEISREAVSDVASSSQPSVAPADTVIPEQTTGMTELSVARVDPTDEGTRTKSSGEAEQKVAQESDEAASEPEVKEEWKEEMTGAPEIKKDRLDSGGWELVDGGGPLDEPPPETFGGQTSVDAELRPAYVSYIVEYLKRTDHVVDHALAIAREYFVLSLGPSACGMFREVVPSEEDTGQRRRRAEGRDLSYVQDGDIIKHGAKSYKVVVAGARPGIVSLVPQLGPVREGLFWQWWNKGKFWFGRGFEHSPALHMDEIPMHGRNRMRAFANEQAAETVTQLAAHRILFNDWNSVEMVRQGGPREYPATQMLDAVRHADFIAQSSGVDGILRWTVGATKRVTRANGNPAHYPWGDCYFCGALLPGPRLPGRACPGDCGWKTSVIFKLYMPVCNTVHRIVYPGKVVLMSQSVDLKPGARTWATEENLRIKGPDRRLWVPKKREAALLAGVGMSGVYPYIFDAGAENLVLAIEYRIFKVVDRRQPNSACFRRMTALAWFLLGDWLRPREPMTQEEWFHTLHGRRLKELRRAQEKYLQRGRLHKDFAYIKAFVKTEHAAFVRIQWMCVTVEKVVNVPRLIQAGHDETHLLAGRWLKKLTRELKYQWNPQEWLFYGSARPEQLDDWLDRHSGAASWFWADYSAFDATHSPESWAMIEEFYHRIYSRVDGYTEELVRTLGVWREPKGRMHLRREGVRIEYDAPVCNASGRDDTALANAVFNGLGLAFAFAAALGQKRINEVVIADLIEASRVTRISIVGDDSIVACTFDVTLYQDAVVDNLRDLGLLVKAESSRQIRDVTYLGCLPLPCEDGRWRWAPTPGRRLFKAFWQCEPSGSPSAWANGVAQQLELGRHVPVIYDLALRIRELLMRTTTKPLERDENKPWTLRDTVTPLWGRKAVETLAYRYKLPVSFIDQDLATIRSIDRLPAVVRLELFEAAILVDDL